MHAAISHMEQINYSACPACGSSGIEYALTATDFTLSQEEFAVWQCRACSLRFTQDAPAPAAIGKYYKADSYISHTDTKKGLINSLYHQVRKRTLQGKQELVNKYTGLHKGSLLDIGAGTGAFCRHMQDGGWRVTGLEPDAATRERAEKLHGLSLADAAELFRLPPGTQDAVTLWHVLEHVHTLHEYLDQIRSILAQNGKVFIAVPNYTSYDAAVYGQYCAAYDVPRHLYHFSPESMTALLQQHRFTLTALQPMWYDSYYVSMLSSQYKNGSPGYLGAFSTGMISNIKALLNRQKCSSLIYIAGKIV